jgi:hypothetical protein
LEGALEGNAQLFRAIKRFDIALRRALLSLKSRSLACGMNRPYRVSASGGLP